MSQPSDPAHARDEPRALDPERAGIREVGLVGAVGVGDGRAERSRRGGDAGRRGERGRRVVAGQRAAREGELVVDDDHRRVLPEADLRADALARVEVVVVVGRHPVRLGGVGWKISSGQSADTTGFGTSTISEMRRSTATEQST